MFPPEIIVLTALAARVRFMHIMKIERMTMNKGSKAPYPKWYLLSSPFKMSFTTFAEINVKNTAVKEKRASKKTDWERDLRAKKNPPKANKKLITVDFFSRDISLAVLFVIAGE